MAVLWTYLQNHCGEERLNCIALITLHRNVKLNYSKSIQDFVRSKQHRQLLNQGIPLLGNLSLDWEFQQCLGKNLGN